MFFFLSVCNICDIVFPSFRSISLYLNWCTKPPDKLYGSKIVLKLVFFFSTNIFCHGKIFADAGEGNIGGNQSFPNLRVATIIRHLNLRLGICFIKIFDKNIFYLNLLKRIFDICDITMWANGCHPNHTPWGLFLLSRYLIKIFYICKSVTWNC